MRNHLYVWDETTHMILNLNCSSEVCIVCSNNTNLIAKILQTPTCYILLHIAMWVTHGTLVIVIMMKYIVLAVLKLLVNAFKSNKCTFSKFDKNHEFDFTFGPSYSFFSRAINFSFCLMFDYTHIVKILNSLMSQNNQ